MPEPEMDYTRYLRQTQIWPRVLGGSNAVEDKLIAEMTPQHAISAMHKLIGWAQPAWADHEIRRAPLALALLEQAVRLPVLYADDARLTNLPVDGSLDDVLLVALARGLGECMDIEPAALVADAIVLRKAVKEALGL